MRVVHITFAEPNCIHYNEMCFRFGVRSNTFQFRLVNNAGAAMLHLLEIIPAASVSHEKDNFERAHVCACGDLVHGDDDPWIIAIAEGRQQVIWVQTTALE